MPETENLLAPIESAERELDAMSRDIKIAYRRAELRSQSGRALSDRQRAFLARLRRFEPRLKRGKARLDALTIVVGRMVAVGDCAPHALLADSCAPGGAARPSAEE